MNAERRGTQLGITLAFMLLGGAIGATIGMLMAPESGEETRKRIASSVKKSGESIGSGIKSAQDQMMKTGEKIGLSSRKLVTKGRSVFTTEGKDVVAEALDAAKRAYLEEKDAWMLKRR